MPQQRRLTPLVTTFSLVVGKSVVVSSVLPIERISVGFGDVAEAMAVSPNELLVNGKAAGSTSLIVWQQGGARLYFDVNVKPNQFLMNDRLATVRREIAKELPGQNITVTSENETILLRGTANDLLSVQRATSIAATSGKILNLMYVNVPAPEAQILLKVRFASLDRDKSTQLGVNLFSTGAGNTTGATSTQQYPGPTLPSPPQLSDLVAPFAVSSLLNIFLYRKDLNLGAMIQALETKGILQVLAEPNLLAENGKQASFLAGGEVPYPVFQGSSSGAGAITVQFREFGVRLNFIPTIMPNGTIRLQVAPEVSALDYTDGLQIQGYSIPGLTSRKVQTTVELQDGQSFAISGLLDKRVTDSYNRVPFIGDIPIIGKLFQSKSIDRKNTELIVIVTPELVRPVSVGAPRPSIQFPQPFLDSVPDSGTSPNGATVSGPVSTLPPNKSIAVETLIESMKPQTPLVITTGSSAPGAAGGDPSTGATPNQASPPSPVTPPKY